VTVVALALAGCSPEAQRGWLPGDSDNEITNQTGRITNLWVGSWVAALLVGILVWGLILWCVAVYRKRKDDDQLPVQLRYHVPLEIMYVVLPIVMVGVLFYYTARDMTEIQDTSAEPDLTVQVIGKQWSWDFNYVDSDVYDTGQHAQEVGRTGVLADQPTLYLPVGERVEFVLDSRDVIHSFWVPAFLYKQDMIPGRTNRFQVVPEVEGDYVGKCAELCGEEHSSMLFNVKVVSRDEYDAHIQDLRDAGQEGQLGLEYNRLQDVRELNTPARLVRGLGLVWEGSPFSAADEAIHVIRWPAVRPALFRRPLGGIDEWSMGIIPGGWVIEKAPFHGSGYASGEGPAIPEFKVDSVRLPHGAELWRIDRSGKETLVAVYDADLRRWTRRDADAAAFGRPSRQRAGGR